jgi:hypothetical protein
MRIGRCLLLAAVLLALASPTPPVAGEAAPPTAREYYEVALAHMRALPEPAYVTYAAALSGEGDHIEISRAPSDGTLNVAVTLGHPTHEPVLFSAAFRASDGVVSTQMKDGTHAITRSGFLNPTWAGAYKMMRDGWDSLGEPTPTPEPMASPSAQMTDIPTIAVVKAISPGFYRIQDGGAQSCPRGVPGHRIHLVAYDDPLEHPLTDAIIDARTQEICSLRFGLRQGLGVGSATGEMVINFERVGEYQVISDSEIGFDIHGFGFELKHMGLSVSYSNLVFPSSLPNAIFKPQLNPTPPPG